MGNISYEHPFKYLFSEKCTRHECCGYCDKCQVPYMETGVYEWDEQTGTYTFRFDEKGAEMKQINENDVCLYDGILLIVADVEWDKAEMPTRWEVKKLYLDAEYDKEPMTFKKIREMFPTSHSIIAICDTALHGEIYRFGNYGESWYQYGTTMGYA